MTTETLKKEQSEQSDKKSREITFKCKFCGKDKPLDDMKAVNGYFPPVIACSECERKLR